MLIDYSEYIWAPLLICFCEQLTFRVLHMKEPLKLYIQYFKKCNSENNSENFFFYLGVKNLTVV